MYKRHAGIRTLAPLEKMYNVRASGNPSSWQGPVWINVNYLVFRGLVKYGDVYKRQLLKQSATSGVYPSDDGFR